MRCPDREFWVKVDPKLPFWGKIRKSGKMGKFSKNEKRQYYHVFIIKIHISVKFYVKIMTFDEIRGHVVILSFCRAQIRDSEGPLRKRAIRFEVEVLDIPNCHRTRLI